MRATGWVLTLLACVSCGASGFSVRFSTVEYHGRAWSLSGDEPSPQRGTGGTRGWQLQSAAADRASWFYTESINEWPPERVLLLLALEDAAAPTAPAAGDGDGASWTAAWQKPGVVAGSALAQVAEVSWLGDATREVADGVETERAPVVLRSGTAWGASLSGGFFVRGHVMCRRDARATLITCALSGLASENAPEVQPADFEADAELAENAQWLKTYLGALQLKRR